MEKLPMCRICLAQNIRMYVVVNKKLHELYKKLTDIPFVTKDRRPILACFICCAKLKRCCQFMMKCLETEEVFAEMTDEDDELISIINEDHSEFYGGLVKTSIKSINILDVGVTECINVKEELPDVCEEQNDIIETKKEHQSNDIKQETQYIGYSDEEHISFPSIRFEKDSDDEVLLMEFKIEVEEEQEVSKQKKRAVETNSSSVAKKQNKPVTGRIILEDTIAAKQMKNEQRKISHTKVIQNAHIRRSKPDTTLIEPFTDTNPRVDSFKNNTAIDTNLCSNSDPGNLSSELWKNKVLVKQKLFKCDFCQRSFNHKGHFTRHIRGHNGEKPYKCEICQRSFSELSNLKRHFLTHAGDKPYKCYLCERCFIDKRDLTKHIYKHIDENPFKCEICSFSSNDKRDLKKHICKLNKKTKKPVCGICQHSCRYASDLKRHMRIHTGEKPYQCDTCQRSFNVKSNLIKHMVVHSAEKPFKNVI